MGALFRIIGANMSYLNAAGNEPDARGGTAERGLRLGGQVLGTILILIGTYFAVLILGACIGILRDPGQSSASVAAMTKTLGLENAEVSSGKNQVPIGKASAGV